MGGDERHVCKSINLNVGALLVFCVDIICTVLSIWQAIRKYLLNECVKHVLYFIDPKRHIFPSFTIIQKAMSLKNQWNSTHNWQGFFAFLVH